MNDYFKGWDDDLSKSNLRVVLEAKANLVAVVRSEVNGNPEATRAVMNAMSPEELAHTAMALAIFLATVAQWTNDILDWDWMFTDYLTSNPLDNDSPDE